MLQPQRAVLLALALMAWRALPVVAVHAVVVRASAVVGRDVAAEVALVLYVSLLVFLAVGDTVLIIGILVKKLALGALVLLECANI